MKSILALIFVSILVAAAMAVQVDAEAPDGIAAVSEGSGAICILGTDGAVDTMNSPLQKANVWMRIEVEWPVALTDIVSWAPGP